MSDMLRLNLGTLNASVTAAIEQLVADKVISRIWDLDHTVWADDPNEITNRLGWLTIMDEMQDNLAEITAFVDGIRAAGITHVELLGMGGSSLAPDVFSKVFPQQAGYPTLSVLDSTDPGAVAEHAESASPAETLYIVATKSGGTSETLSFFKYFYNRALETMSPGEAAQHFVAITDPGSKLVKLAQDLKFRKTFINNPNIGGRFSVMSYFGIVPAALIGVDVAKLIGSAWAMSAMCREDASANPGLQLGVVMGVAAMQGRDKLSLTFAPQLAPLGDWIEQLVAESTGKVGQGILPVVGEPLAAAQAYGSDRLFVDHMLDDAGGMVDSAALAETGHPVITLVLDDLYDLGAQFFLWEMATAVAGHILGIQPFDQPDVEAAKVQARKFIAQYQETGVLDEGEYTAVDAETFKSFVAQAVPGNYFCVQAYVKPDPAVDAFMRELRTRLREATGSAVTVGYGPRFLHSTGQLHKGDSGTGLFIQITSDAGEDLAIPDEAGSEESAMSFNVLKTAQALGDYSALLDAKRRVVRYKVGADVAGDLAVLLS